MNETGSRPATLRWAVGLLFAEAVGVAVVAGYLVYRDATSTGVGGRAVGITGFAVAMALLPAGLGWALVRRHGWARGPAVVLELLLLPVGWYMVAGGLAWLGVPVFAAGLLVVGLLLVPATREALGTR